MASRDFKDCIDNDILGAYERNPRAFRRNIADHGLFCRLPIDGSDKVGNEAETRIRYFWRAVIDRALLDIIEVAAPTNISISAFSWVCGADRSEGKHFKLVCELADLPPDIAKTYILKIKDTKDTLTKNGTVNIYDRKWVK